MVSSGTPSSSLPPSDQSQTTTDLISSGSDGQEQSTSSAQQDTPGNRQPPPQRTHNNSPQNQHKPSNLTGQLAEHRRVYELSSGSSAQQIQGMQPQGSSPNITSHTDIRRNSSSSFSTSPNLQNLTSTPSNRFLSTSHGNGPRPSPISVNEISGSPGRTNNNSSVGSRGFSIAQNHNQPSLRSSTPRLGALTGPSSSIDDLTDGQKATIVRRHLMSKHEQRAARRKNKNFNPELGQSFDSRRTGLGEEDEGDEEDGDDLTQAGIETDAEGTDDRGLPGSADTQAAQEELEPHEDYPTPFHLPGGDVNHALYKWASKQAHSSGLNSLDQSHGPSSLALARTRSLSMSVASVRGSDIGGANNHGGTAETSNDIGIGLTHRDIMEPGGFRRAFLYQKRAAIGKPCEFGDGTKATRSFIDFLSLYGHFGGEDLEEIDEGEEEAFRALHSKRSLEGGRFYSEDEQDQDDEPSATRITERTTLLNKSTNLRPVLPTRKSIHSQASRSRSASRYPGFRDGSNGSATVPQAVLMTLKSLVGTGILLLAKAFANGGMLFSILMLIFVSIISLYSYVLLVETRLQIAGGFGEMAGILYGPWLRKTVLFSLVISQLGFVSAYTIFIAQSLQAFFLAVTDCKTLLPIYVLIFGQVLVYLPLAMVRNIQKLSWTALVADAFILIGLIYVFGYEFSSIATKGPAPIKMFNVESFPLMIGTAVFTFEGIGLVIPITESMKEPQKFPRVLTLVISSLTVLLAGAGAAGYAAYGKDVQPVVLVNLPQGDRSVNAVQFLYSMAIMLSTPLQLFPAVRIMENGLFSESGKYSNKVKWRKNFFRTGTVMFCAFTAWVGAADFDKFVSLIGSVACVPLCFCYPAMLHYKAIAKTFRQKALDLSLAIFGLVAAFYTSYQTLSLIFNGDESEPPVLGKC